jgi:hypothetical protein
MRLIPSVVLVIFIRTARDSTALRITPDRSTLTLTD